MSHMFTLFNGIASVQVALTVLGLMSLLSASSVQARDTAPHIYYNNSYYDSSAGGTWGAYETPEEAFEVSKAVFEAMYSLDPHNIVSDMFVDPSTTLWNGQPQEYRMHYTTVGWPGTSWATATEIGVECPDDMQISNPIFNVTPTHYTVNMFCMPKIIKPEPACNCETVGDPIYPSTGMEQEDETDYEGAGSNTLRFTRTYRSDRKGWRNNYQIVGIDFTGIQQALSTQNMPFPLCYMGIGQTTKKPFCFPYVDVNDGELPAPTYDFAIQRGNGRMLNFGTATDLSPVSADINDRVSKVSDGNGNTVGWSVYNADNDATELYDLTGRLQTTTARNGQVQTFVYSDATTASTIATQAGLLIKISDVFGHSLSFTYDSNEHMQTMTDPSGGIYAYAYDESSSIVLSGNYPVGNLTSVTYPDGKKKIYWYNEQDKTANTNLPFAMTGVTDETGARYVTINYDSTGKAVSSELAGGAEKYTVAYPNPNVQSTVVDPLGSSRSYNFQNLLGVVQFTGQTQPAGAGSPAASTTITYDVNSNVASKTDFNGNQTTYLYDLIRNLETSRTEAAGTAQARTITTTWHPTFRLPLVITEPGRTTTYTYDANGNQLTKTIAASGNSRTWTNTYNAAGQILTVTGPRTDVADVTTYTYDASGNLNTVKNALGQITTLSNYDANGRVGLITDPNGATTALTYAPRGWLTNKVVTAGSTVQSTTYTYDNAGQLTQVTLPDSSSVSYTYDPARRLTNIKDSLGNSINYALDLMGNRTSETVTDPNGVLTRQISRIFDAVNRLQQVTGAAQ